MSHEGGYTAMYAPYCGLAVLEEMTGIKTHIDDPWAPLMIEWGQQGLQPHQRAAVDRAAGLVGNIN
jgi:hypothetical protein